MAGLMHEPGPIAILAGSGRFPALLADSLRRGGCACRILAFRGFADPGLRHRADETVDLLDVKRALACLSAWQPSAVTFAGGVRRPSPAAVLGAFSALRNRRELGELMGRGDDQLLRGVVRLLEEHGHRVVGVRDLAPELLARPGVQGAHRPSEADVRAVAIGVKLLADISPYDIGQGAVVSAERVIAVEGPEGTDRMLARVRRLVRPWGIARHPPAGVLVKLPKRNQDLRVDLPAIGARTFVRAARAGLRGIAVGSGATLVLDRDETVGAADRLGLFLIGIEADRAGPARPG